MSHLRLLAPDVTRGGLLLLIALANVPLWTQVRERSTDTVDLIISRIVAAFVDGRCYPVFALLFGYGLATLAERYAETLVPYRDAKYRLMRRLVVLLLFGLVHALVFSGDILGPYAVSGLLATPLVIRARSTTLAWVAGALYCLELASLPAYGMVAGVGQDGPSTYLTESYQPLLGLLDWSIVVFILGPLSILPLIMLGALVRRFRLVARYPSRPWLVRRTALWAPGISLVLCTIAGLWTWNFGGNQLEGALSIPNNVAGLVMGLGYLAAVSTWCRRWEGLPLTRVPAPLLWLRAVGQRSLTCYALQTVGFVALVVPWGALKLGNALPYWAILGVAALIWCVTVAVAVWLEGNNKPGPLDALLRRLSTPRR